jgi:hypothetical protein
MSTIAFDAVITLRKRHLVAAGLSGREADAVDAVRTAVEAIDGALCDRCGSILISDPFGGLGGTLFQRSVRQARDPGIAGIAPES